MKLNKFGKLMNSAMTSLLPSSPLCKRLVQLCQCGGPQTNVNHCHVNTKLRSIEFDGPTPKAPQVVQMLDVKAPKQVTLRLLTPEHYRRALSRSKDTPVLVISEWAQLLGEPVASLTGGTWERLATPRGQLLIAHICTSESLAAKVCGLSGRRGLFATVVQKQNRAPVSWQFRSTDATDEAYFREAEKEAQTLQVPLALRQGGPHDVGLVGTDPRPILRDRRRSWELFGAPSHWCQQQIDSFFDEWRMEKCGAQNASSPQRSGCLAFSGHLSFIWKWRVRSGLLALY